MIRSPEPGGKKTPTRSHFPHPVSLPQFLSPRWGLLLLWVGWLASGHLTLVTRAANQDESKVRPYRLPDPLRLEDGRAVTNAQQWIQERRSQVLRLFEDHVYGRPLPTPTARRFLVVREDPQALGGRAIRQDVQLEILQPRAGIALDFTIFLPRSATGAIPMLVGLHLFDTAAPEPRPAVGRRLPGQPTPDPTPAGKATLEAILNRGFGLASLNLGYLAPDSPTEYRRGAAYLMGIDTNRPPEPTETGALGIWAWGLSRALDYFETVPEIDAHRVAVIGHSRMGKAALWASAQDPRFAWTIANNSGCGGAALSKRDYGETVEIITRAFPHWFAPHFRTYAGHEDQLPVDQHQLIALLAPRPVYVGSAAEDHWADPQGEFLALVHAEPVFHLLGTPGLGTTSAQPQLDQPLGATLRYHRRAGQHDLTDVDWEHYLRFLSP